MWYDDTMSRESVTRFWDWVRREAYKRGWSIREVDRRAGFRRGRIGNAASRGRAPTVGTMEGIARAFDISLVDVERQAGYLPPAPPQARIREFDRIAAILATLPDGPIRAEAMAAIEAIADSARRRALAETAR